MTTPCVKEQIPLDSSDDNADNDGENRMSKWDYNGDDVSQNAQTSRISTRDLICWSFQIARAMDFLGRKKVIFNFKTFYIQLMIF